MFNSFGSKVRIKETPETQEKELAGKIGSVYGQTKPSMMALEIIGTPKDDIAINVYFDDLKTSYWFDQDLLEKLDDGEGTVITLDGVDKKWTKGRNNQWIEEGSTSKVQAISKKWWEFWK